MQGGREREPGSGFQAVTQLHGGQRVEPELLKGLVPVNIDGAGMAQNRCGIARYQLGQGPLTLFGR